MLRTFSPSSRFPEIASIPFRLKNGQNGGWRQLTIRYGVFFLALAALNEVIWRTQPAETWVWFKFPGLAILTVIFSFSQVPGMLKDARAMEAAARAAETQD